MAFNDEIHEAGANSYTIGFKDCLKRIKKFYPDMDISKITSDKTDDEDGDEEQAEDVLVQDVVVLTPTLDRAEDTTTPAPTPDQVRGD